MRVSQVKADLLLLPARSSGARHSSWSKAPGGRFRFRVPDAALRRGRALVGRSVLPRLALSERRQPARGSGHGFLHVRWLCLSDGRNRAHDSFQGGLRHWIFRCAGSGVPGLVRTAADWPGNLGGRAGGCGRPVFPHGSVLRLRRSESWRPAGSLWIGGIRAAHHRHRPLCAAAFRQAC